MVRRVVVVVVALATGLGLLLAAPGGADCTELQSAYADARKDGGTIVLVDQDGTRSTLRAGEGIQDPRVEILRSQLDQAGCSIPR